MFTGRFGPGTGEVLFDRICRENGVRHLLTAPHAPTTTGKVERFHKMVRAEFLKERTFASLAEAQEALDAWIEGYNTRRPHQGIGMVPPEKRFAVAVAEPPQEVVVPEGEEPQAPPGRKVTRVVGQKGTISLATFGYHVGTWLAGETVEVYLRDDGLLEIYHRGVLIAAHARRHPHDKEPKIRARRTRRPTPRPSQPPTPGPAVLRLVDSTGTVSFAGTGHRVGRAYRSRQVEVRLVGDTVEFWLDGERIRVHTARHDPSKEYGAYATPGGRPRRINASS